MKKLLLLISISSIQFLVLAQESPIFTDRPNVTDAVTLISPGTFQIESGFFQSMSKEESGFPSQRFLIESTNITLPNFSLKFGLFKWMEFRILFNYRIDKLISDSSPDFRSEGFTPIIVSPKFCLLRQSGFLPETTLVTGFTLPNGRNATYRSDFNLALNLLLQYTLSKFSLAGSIGTDWQGTFDQSWFYRYTLVGGFAITDKLGTFLELYGNFADELVGIDAGFTYLITNSLQIDVIYDTNLNGINSHGFGFGIAWKTDFKE